MSFICTPTDIIRMLQSERLRLAGHVPRMGDIRNAYKSLVRNLKGRALGRPRSRAEYNIKVYVKERGWEVVTV